MARSPFGAKIKEMYEFDWQQPGDQLNQQSNSNSKSRPASPTAAAMWRQRSMNLKTKLEGRENAWLRVFFVDGTSFTGILRQVGADYLELECFSPLEVPVIQQGRQLRIREGQIASGQAQRALHLLPLNLIKYFTVESEQFVEAERSRLEHLVRQPLRTPQAKLEGSSTVAERNEQQFD